MSLQFRFDELKSVQAAALIAQQPGIDMCNYLKLIKLLYLADCNSLLQTGTTITGDSFCNMKNGQVLSNVLRCIKEPKLFQIWNGYFSKNEYKVLLISDPGDSELSDFDVDILLSLSKEFEKYTWGEMIEYHHKLPEWRDPGEGRYLLDPIDVLRARGVDDEIILEFESQNEYIQSVQRMFGQ